MWFSGVACVFVHLCAVRVHELAWAAAGSVPFVEGAEAFSGVFAGGLGFDSVYVCLWDCVGG